MSKRTKICFVSIDAYPLFNPNCKSTFGGAEVQLFLLGVELAKDPAFDIYFIVGDYGQKPLEIIHNIKVYKLEQLDNRKMRSIFPYGKFWFIYLMVKIRADIYAQRTASNSTGLICFFAKLMGKKFIFMTASEVNCNGKFEKKSNWLTSKLFRYGIQNADLVVTQSVMHQSMIREYYQRESVVMQSMYKIPDMTSYSHLDKSTILWVGRAEDVKQPHLFITFAKQFPHEKFIMIAPRSHNQESFFEEVKAKAKTVPNLTFIDFVPFAEIDAYFKSAKIYVLTSKYEGFPNTFVQAAKNMTPILSLNVNPDGFLEKYGLGLCTDGNEALFVTQLENLLIDVPLRIKMGEYAYRYAKEYHDIRVIVEEYKKLYNSVV